MDAEDTQLGYVEWVLGQLQHNHADDPRGPEDYWDICSKYPPDDWRCAVMDNNTKLGYREWVEHCLEDAKHDAEFEKQNQLQKSPDWFEQAKSKQFKAIIQLLSGVLREQYETHNKHRSQPEDFGVLTRQDLEEVMEEIATLNNYLLDLGQEGGVYLEPYIPSVHMPCPGPDICNGNCDDLSCDADK